MTKKAMKAPLTREEQQMLRERFNPEGSPIRRQQLRMLDMLVAIDEICRRHLPTAEEFASLRKHEQQGKASYHSGAATQNHKVAMSAFDILA